MEHKLINEKIRDNRLNVIDEEGNRLGEMSKYDAIDLARERGLDLVLFVPSQKTGALALAKIIDYGKYNYEQKMKEKQSRKNQSVVKVKEVKVRPQIGTHDLKWRAERCKEWLADGCQIKFKIQAYGRIGYKPEIIEETYQKFLGLIGDSGKVLTQLKKLTPVMYEATLVKNK